MAGLNNKKGLTLTEVIISVGLMAVILLAGAMLLIPGARGFSGDMAQAGNQMNVRAAISAISNSFRGAEDIIADGDSFTLDGERFYCENKTLKKTPGDVLLEGIDGMSATKYGDGYKIIVWVGEGSGRFELETMLYPRATT